MINISKRKLIIGVPIICAAFLLNLRTFASENNIPLRATSTATKETSSIKSLSPAPAQSQGIQLKGGVKIDKNEQLITLTLTKSDIRQVLRMLADKSHKNIILDDSVTGEISLDLVNVTVNKAFEYVMTLKQLTYWQDGNTIIVATSEQANKLGLNKTEIKPIKIKYVDAQKVADFLNKNIFTTKSNKPDISQSSIVTSNPATNELFVFGTKNDYELAKKVAAEFDKEMQVNTYNVNFADIGIMASKLCMSVFQNIQSTPSTIDTGMSTVCSGTAATSSSSDESGVSPFTAPSYSVIADADLNQITIYGGTQEQIIMANQIIKAFDKKQQQVYLEISIIELSEDGSKAFNNMIQGFAGNNALFGTAGGKSGIGYSMKKIVNFNKAILAIDKFTAPSGLNIPESPSEDVPAIYMPAGNNVYGSINAIVSRNKGRILANPRILASNNTQSTVNIKEDVVSGVVTNIVQGASTTSTTTAQHGEVGIDLTVTPKISPNGFVSLDLNPSYKSVKGDDGYGGTLTRTRDFEAKNVRVKDGETLIIAGLIQETESSAHKNTPIFSDIPIVGFLFKDQATTKSRSELIFMITPRIVEDDENTVKAI